MTGKTNSQSTPLGVDADQVPLIPLDRARSSLETDVENTDRVLLCLDFDGTLAPHVDDPDAAELTADNRRLLTSLVCEPALDVAIISGRALGDVKDRVGIDGIAYAGNHGLEIDDGDGTHSPSVEDYRSSIHTVCAQLETELENTGCEVEDKEETATVHYRNTDAGITPETVEETVTTVIERVGADLQVVSGTEIVEIRPAINWHKGHAVREIETRCRGECLTIYIGDDTTDEDAFRELAGDGIGIYVGRDSDSAASYRVPGVEGVTGFLSWLAETGVHLLRQ